MPIIRPSEIETARFGMAIGRVECPAGADSATLAKEILNYDLVVLRTCSDNQALPRELMARGIRVLPADTLVYYEVALDRWDPLPSSGHGPTFRGASAADAEAVALLARKAFAGYHGHYAASPALKASAVIEGYAEWAARLASGGIPKSRVSLVIDDGELAGFIGGQIVLDGERTTFEIALNAVSPDRHNRGLYTAGLNHLLRQLKSDGIERAIISTQVWNYVVQRVWCNIGLRIYKSLCTYHAYHA